MLKQNLNRFVYPIIVAILLVTPACAPSQADNNPDQCPDSGVKLKALLDEQYTAIVPQVHSHMTAYMN